MLLSHRRVRATDQSPRHPAHQPGLKIIAISTGIVSIKSRQCLTIKSRLKLFRLGLWPASGLSASRSQSCRAEWSINTHTIKMINWSSTSGPMPPLPPGFKVTSKHHYQWRNPSRLHLAILLQPAASKSKMVLVYQKWKNPTSISDRPFSPLRPAADWGLGL